RLQPVPRPRLDALRERVVDDHRDVDVLGLVARHVLLELFLRIGNDREVFRGDAVALRAVAVSAERDAPPARLACRQHDAAGDASGEVLLKDAAIDDFTDQGCHALLLSSPVRVVGHSSWSAGLTREGTARLRYCQDGDSQYRSPPPETGTPELADLAEEPGQGVGERFGLLHIR